MVPTLIAFGVIFGRWWRSALAVGVLGWVVVLLSGDIITVGAIPVTALVALVNTGVGVALHQAVLRLVRAVRTRGAARPRHESGS